MTVVFLLGIRSPVFAEVYWWPNNEHECSVVESVRSDLFQNPKGYWLEGKVDFSLKATTCHAYASGNHSEEPDDPRVLKNLASCQRYDRSPHAYQVIQFYGGVAEFDLEITRETEMYTQRIPSQSHVASASFYIDGVISLNIFPEAKTPRSGEMYMVTAKCTTSDQ